jgi:hypothetical protein
VFASVVAISGVDIFVIFVVAVVAFMVTVVVAFVFAAVVASSSLSSRLPSPLS